MDATIGWVDSSPDGRLSAFENAWRSGVRPSLDAFRAEPGSVPEPAREQELAQLIAIDLEYRWRAHGRAESGELPARPRLEHYLARYPGLAQNREALLELVLAEYRTRQLWGDRPGRDEYPSRFPLLASLETIPFDFSPTEFDREFRTSQAAEAAAAEAKPAREDTGRLEQLGILGRGGMGVVYKAVDPRLRRLVAVKKLSLGGGASSEHRARFDSEAKAAARLKHPHIVTIHAVGDDDGFPYLVMEYLDGGRLTDRLASGPLAIKDAAVLLVTLARAVQAAHDADVVHRDLKPSNILYTSNGVPKISDFGLAKLLDDDSARTGTGEVLGTPSYMSPEQAEGRTRDVGPAADIYALGAILYHTLTGRPPFSGESPLETMQLVARVEPAHPRRMRPGVPRDLETICLKCLEKQPNRRYASARELADDLERFLRREPVKARRISRPERAWRWGRRHPWPTALAASIVLALLAFTAVTAQHNLALRNQIQRADRQTELARARYREARDTLRSIVERTGDGSLSGSPRILDMRHDVLEKVMAFHQKILNAQDSDDPAVTLETARTLDDNGVYLVILGKYDEASRSAHRAVELYENFRKIEPNNHDATLLESRCLARIAVGATPGEPAEARIDYGRRALALTEAVLAREPKNETARELVGMCWHNYAIALASCNHKDEALSAYDRAIKAREALDHTIWKDAKLSIARSQINQGVIQWQFGRFAEAEQTLRKARAILDELAAVPAAKHDVVMTIAQLDTNLSGVLNYQSRFQDSLALTPGDIDALERFLASEPNDALVRASLFSLHGNRATAYSSLKQHHDACREVRKMLQFCSPEDHDHYTVELLLELFQAGEIEEVARSVGELRKSSRLSSQDRYNTACVYGDLAKAAQGDKSLDPATRRTKVEAYQSQAIEWLTYCREAGGLDRKSDLDDTRKNPDLLILRGRPEFEELLRKAEASLKPAPARPGS